MAIGWLLLAWFGAGCGSASRAMVHEEDMAKVFPWPDRKASVTVRVKPRTTMVNMCSLFGSYEEVEVTPQTTFYMLDELGKKLAYTPSRSPIRRLAPIQSMEIRWPQAGPGAPATETTDESEASGASPTPPEAPTSDPPTSDPPAGG
jgi:hypothetical protein